MFTKKHIGLCTLSLAAITSLGSACVGPAQYDDEEVGEASQAVLGSTGYALYFNGSNAFVDIDMGATIPTNPVSIEVWFKSAAASGEVPIAGVYDAALTNATQRIYLKNGKVCSKVKSGGAENEACTPTGGWANDAWHHVEVTVGPTNGHVLYVDAQARATQSAVTFVDGGSSHIVAGKDTTSFFTGLLDELRIWSSERLLGNVRGGAFREHPAAPFLLGSWRFNEMAGATAADSSGNGHPGVVTNPSWIGEIGLFFSEVLAPIYNKSMEFSPFGWGGSASYVSVLAPNGGPPVELQFRDAGSRQHSYEMWALPTVDYAYDDPNQITRGFMISDAASFGLALCADGTAGTNELCYTYCPHSATTMDLVPTGVAVDVDEWSHIAWTYDGVSALKLYVNGALVHTGNHPSPLVSCNANQGFFLGAPIVMEGQIPYQYFGYLDDVRVWNVARSQADIQANMNVQIGGANSQLKANWYGNGLLPKPPSNPNEADKVPDATIRRYDGVLNNVSFSMEQSPGTNNQQ